MVALRNAVPAFALVLALGACGGDDSTSETTSAPTAASPTTSTTVTEVAETAARASRTEASVADAAAPPGAPRPPGPPSPKVAEPAAGASGTEASVADGAVDPGPEGEGDVQEGSDTTLPPAMPAYEVIHRLIVDDRTTLVILVEPGSYSTVQLENLVYDVVDTFSPNTAIVVDERDAADLAIRDDLTPEEQSVLDDRTFLRIENGVDVTFHGPYADAGGMTVGS